MSVEEPLQNNTISIQNTQQFQMPKKLITPTNYRNYMHKKNMQINVDSSINILRDDLNSSIQHSMFQNQFTSVPSRQYHYSVRNMKTVCDHDFSSGNTRYHDYQKFGTRKSTNQKLKPLAQANEFQKNAATKINRKPRRQKVNQDQRSFIKKVIFVKGKPLLITINSFQVQLKSENASMSGIQDGIVTECKLNFSDSHYLAQQSNQKINEFFSNYILLDEEYISFEFDRFQQQPFVAETIQEQVDMENVTYLEKNIETEDDNKTVVMHLPYMQIEFNQLNFKTKIYLSKQEFCQLLEDEFVSSEKIVNNHVDDNKDLAELLDNKSKVFNIQIKLEEKCKDTSILSLLPENNYESKQAKSLQILEQNRSQYVVLLFIDDLQYPESIIQNLEQLEQINQIVKQQYSNYLHLYLVTKENNNSLIKSINDYNQMSNEQLEINIILDQYGNLSDQFLTSTIQKAPINLVYLDQQAKFKKFNSLSYHECLVNPLRTAEHLMQLYYQI